MQLLLFYCTLSSSPNNFYINPAEKKKMQLEIHNAEEELKSLFTLLLSKIEELTINNSLVGLLTEIIKHENSGQRFKEYINGLKLNATKLDVPNVLVNNLITLLNQYKNRIFVKINDFLLNYMKLYEHMIGNKLVNIFESEDRYFILIFIDHFLKYFQDEWNGLEDGIEFVEDLCKIIYAMHKFL